MKVIKEGSGQKGWAKKFTCTGEGNNGGGCGAILLVEAKDLFSQTSSAMGEVTTYISFRCCQCGHTTDIWNSDSCEVCPVPYTVRDAIRKRH